MYSYLVLIYLLIKTPDPLAPPIIPEFYKSRFYGFNWYIQVCYYTLYFYFYIYFLDLPKHLPRYYRNLRFAVIGLFAISTLLFIYSILYNEGKLYMNYFTMIYVPISLSITITTIVYAFKIPGKLKYFITIGSCVYISLALTSMYFSMKYTLETSPVIAPIIFFFFGLIFEHFVFALGLAYKVKLISENMVFQFKENERIKNNQNEILSQRLKEKESELLEISARAEKDRMEKLKSEFDGEINRLKLELLKTQMNPHFIFNALTSIKVFLIDNDKKKAVYYLNKFSKLIRKLLDSYRSEAHSLEEELELLQLYLSIENIRFNSEIDIHFENSNEVNSLNIMIPPLLSQPFVENAIWHGLMPSERKEKKITIKTFQENGISYLSIEDNGIGRIKSAEYKENRTFKKNSIGIKLVQERIDFFNLQYGYQYYYEILDLLDHSGKPIGTKVILCFNSSKKEPIIQ
jgi:hypothetical protein